MHDLVDHAVKILEKLDNKEINAAEAGVRGKLCEVVAAATKTEMDYARMLGKEPKIPFMDDISNNKDIVVKEKIVYLPSK